MSVNLTGFPDPQKPYPTSPTLVELVAVQAITTLLPYQDKLRYKAGLFDADVSEVGAATLKRLTLSRLTLTGFVPKASLRENPVRVIDR